MKLISQISAGLACFGLLVAASAQDAVKFSVPGVTPASSTPPAKSAAPAAQSPAPTAAPSAAPAAAVKYSDVQLLEAYGFILAIQYQLVQQTQAFEFTPAQKEAVVRGIGYALNGKELSYDPQQVQAQLKEFLAKKQDTYLDKVRTAFTTATTEYFSKLKENKAVVELPSGLRYEIIKPGTGAVAKPGQVVVGNFSSALVNGQVIAASDPQRGPAKFLLEPKLVPGLLEGLQKVGVGGKIRLHIPPNLAYGDEGTDGVPPGAALIFDVEVVGVEDAPKDAGK